MDVEEDVRDILGNNVVSDDEAWLTLSLVHVAWGRLTHRRLRGHHENTVDDMYVLLHILVHVSVLPKHSYDIANLHWRCLMWTLYAMHVFVVSHIIMLLHATCSYNFCIRLLRALMNLSLWKFIVGNHLPWWTP
jgi:hypothetical protein